jgi:transcriptional regulator with XRE-family HTH domain
LTKCPELNIRIDNLLKGNGLCSEPKDDENKINDVARDPNRQFTRSTHPAECSIFGSVQGGMRGSGGPGSLTRFAAFCIGATEREGVREDMKQIPEELRQTIAENVRYWRNQKYPGKGGSKKCADAFGVSQQQWSPWERGTRTPGEIRLRQIATFFGTTVEWLLERHQFDRDGELTDDPEKAFSLKVERHEIAAIFQRVERLLSHPKCDYVTINITVGTGTSAAL